MPHGRRLVGDWHVTGHHFNKLSRHRCDGDSSGRTTVAIGRTAVAIGTARGHEKGTLGHEKEEHTRADSRMVGLEDDTLAEVTTP